jgi:creatinine amidohydrolase
MRFEDLNWMDIEQYLKDDDRIMLVLGSCEQHGYLSLQTDTKIPLAMADAASEQTGVLVAPSLPLGVSPDFMDFPGTISLKLSTYLCVVREVIGSLYRHGFRGFLLLNGHGGNRSVKPLLSEIVEDFRGLRVKWFAWWQSAAVNRVAKEHNLEIIHANGAEAFPFTRTGPLPEGKKDHVSLAGIFDPATIRRLLGDGVFGGPYQVSPELHRRIFEAAVADLIHQLRGIEEDDSDNGGSL